jgi:hypothetical protein
MAHRRTLVLLAGLAALTACSTRQGYASAQAWKRNQCLQVLDSQERLRCLKEADQSYDSYQKETEALKAPR